MELTKSYIAKSTQNYLFALNPAGNLTPLFLLLAFYALYMG